MIDTELIVDLKITVPLRITDFDRFKQIKPSSVLELFQEAATKQAEAMDIGFDAMAKRGVFWIVVRTYYELFEQPALYSDVIVHTWPHTPSRFSFLRDYTLSTGEGNVIAIGTSEWVLMDKESREFIPLTSVYEAPDNLLKQRNFEKKPRKLKDFEVPEKPALTICPQFSTVDMNGHVNNSYYADFPFDALTPQEPLGVRTFQIDYRQEIRQKETIDIYSDLKDGVLNTKGVDAEGTIMFASRAELSC